MKQSSLQFGVDRLSGRKGGHPNRSATRNLLGLPIIGDSNMKKILLTQGKFALVDDEDYDFLMHWKWYAVKGRSTWYAARFTRHPTKGWAKPIMIQMHRLIMRTVDGRFVDHVNHNGLDNRQTNMRNCNCAENGRNMLPRKNCASKYKGVFRAKTKWQARITCNYKAIQLGNYTSEIEAAIAYNAKAKQLFGEFARLNNV